MSPIPKDTTENPLDDIDTTVLVPHHPSNTPSNIPPKKLPGDIENLLDTRGVCRAMNCGRWKIWKLCLEDPDFPNPRDIAGKNQWFASEIEEYKRSRPRRIYTAVVAVLAVVAVAALLFTDFFWA